MHVMRIVLFFLIGGVSVSSWAYTFTPMKSEILNQRLQACLDKYECRIVGTGEVCRKTTSNPAQSPTSCHLQCRAIDIFKVSCAKTGSIDNKTNLTILSKCLAARGFYTCYNGTGGCHDPHRDHLHFGGDESKRCRFPGEGNIQFFDDLITDF